jgi:hypothetical protein
MQPSHAGRVVAERHKREGVYYALTDEGLELPVIDVGHPAFALVWDDAEQRRFVDAFLRERQPLERLPAFLRRRLLRFFLRESVLGRGLFDAEDSFLAGMSTYLFKLGPDNLSGTYAKPIDRKIAASAPAFGMRLRLQDLARLLADEVRNGLRASAPERPLHFVDIAGGPAMDALNALLLVSREDAALLRTRLIQLDVLDLHREGPHFGARALAALSTKGAPLHRIDVRLRHVRYDWKHPAALDGLLAEARDRGALVVASSEGGLFDYGSDEVVIANLTALRVGTRGAIAVAGSTTRADAAVQKLRLASSVRTIPRRLQDFRELVARAGFGVERVLERPFSDHFVLKPLLAA